MAAVLALFDAVVATWSSQVHPQAHARNFLPPLGPLFGAILDIVSDVDFDVFLGSLRRVFAMIFVSFEGAFGCVLATLLGFV